MFGESTTENAICYVCNQLQTESRTLYCHHSFCTLCLKLTFEPGSILPIIYCPKCNQKCKLDKLGVLGLPRNMEVEKIVQFYKQNQSHVHHTPEFQADYQVGYQGDYNNNNYQYNYAQEGYNITQYNNEGYNTAYQDPNTGYNSYDYNYNQNYNEQIPQPNSIYYPNIDEITITTTHHQNNLNESTPSAVYSDNNNSSHYPQNLNTSQHYNKDNLDTTIYSDNSNFYNTKPLPKLDFEEVNSQNDLVQSPKETSKSNQTFHSRSLSSPQFFPVQVAEDGNKVFFTYDFGNNPKVYSNSLSVSPNEHLRQLSASASFDTPHTLDHHNVDDKINYPTLISPPPYHSDHQKLSPVLPVPTDQIAQQNQPTENNKEDVGLLNSITSTISSGLEYLKNMIFPEDDVTSTATNRKQSTPYYSPFSVNSDQAQAKLEKWLSSLWFAPYGFAKSCKKDALHPVFIPYYLFSATSHTVYKSSVQKALATNTIEGIIENNYNNIFLSASAIDERATFLKEFEDDWKTQTAKSPTSELSIVLETPKAWEEVWRHHSRHFVFHKEDEHCKEALRKQGFQFTDVSVSLGYKDVKSKLIYLPAYEGNYYHEGKRYRVAVNGHTGKVIGERPYGAGGLGGLGSKLTGLFSKK